MRACRVALLVQRRARMRSGYYFSLKVIIVSAHFCVRTARRHTAQCSWIGLPCVGVASRNIETVAHAGWLAENGVDVHGRLSASNHGIKFHTGSHRGKPDVCVHIYIREDMWQQRQHGRLFATHFCPQPANSDLNLNI